VFNRVGVQGSFRDDPGRQQATVFWFVGRLGGY
jgi:hypothetical protein